MYIVLACVGCTVCTMSIRLAYFRQTDKYQSVLGDQMIVICCSLIRSADCASVAQSCTRSPQKTSIMQWTTVPRSDDKLQVCTSILISHYGACLWLSWCLQLTSILSYFYVNAEFLQLLKQSEHARKSGQFTGLVGRQYVSFCYTLGYLILYGYLGL